MVKILWADADGLCLFTKRMERSLSAENARLRVLLDTQQRSLEQMVEYNRLLSQRVAAYASEINRLKALVAKLQRMQFGKSSEKLREKAARQVREAEERISALQEEMANSMTRYCHSRCASLLPVNLSPPNSRAKPACCCRQKSPARRAAESSAPPPGLRRVGAAGAHQQRL